MSVEQAFLTALLDRLRNDPGVQTVLGGRVFEAQPQGIRYPYLYTGRSESEPEPVSETRLVNHRLTLLIRGRRDDRDSLKLAASAIGTALDKAPLVLAPPFACVMARTVYADLFATQDSRILQGLVRIRALLETSNQGDA